jgi:hypothetical protein
MTSTPDYQRTRLWLNSLLIIGLFAAHVVTQHRFVSLSVAPVRTDPCDAVNAYAFIAIAFILIAWIWRIFRAAYLSPSARYLCAARSQQAALFAIFMTFAAEVIALARSAAAWEKIVSPTGVFAVLACLVPLTAGLQLVIFFRERTRISLKQLRWTRAILPVAISLLVLAVCPEWPDKSPSRMAHILTVGVGAFVVFIPMRLLVSEIVLQRPNELVRELPRGYVRSATLLLCGVVVTLCGFFRHIPFLVIAIAELMIAHATLGRLLGFGRSEGPIQAANPFD